MSESHNILVVEAYKGMGAFPLATLQNLFHGDTRHPRFGGRSRATTMGSIMQGIDFTEMEHILDPPD